MPSIFEPALEMVLRHEGGLEYDRAGGTTNLGISFTFLKRVKPDASTQDIEELTVNDAAAIYKKYFWERAFEEINSQKIVNRVFDLQVNTWDGIKLLQRAVNACIGNHLDIDGSLGSKSITAVNSIDEDKLYDALINQAELYYKGVVADHPEDSIFAKGWENRLHS